MVTEGRFSRLGGLARLTGSVRAVVETVLVVLLAVLLARAGWLMVAPADAVSPLSLRPLPSPIQQTTRTDVRSDLSLLLARNPFGTGSAAPVEAVPDAPETSLNLKLVALFMSTDSDADSATIITPDNRSQRFQPGDDIIPGVVLQRVLADRVIISRNGSEESLIRGGREAGLSVISDPSEGPAATSTVSAPPPAVFAPGVSARTLLASLDPVPETTDDRIGALILRPRSNPQLMRAAGLEPGDRLIEINGSQVSELDMSGLAAEFGSARTISVTVLRDGGARTLEINFGEG